ncbi:hypothetical protein [Kribbella jiaozuonensis]|uniref:Uncharacterized protein n=1 Tax=Kribbella jiaozuonensis TaxID=2575441 RepID=A0A4U3LJH9_9ACTN|nr:hypothetical protein [Kribbella jiaozuonensis]TKK75582.1 hypothetical protein FDA38_34925 [Kribbella jiaozuonensis]
MVLAGVAVGMDMSFSDLVRAPKVELPDGARQWVEESLRLLIEHFGTDPLRRPVVVPGEFVPAGYDGSEGAARELCLLVAERMGIPAGRIRFSFQLEKVVEAGQLLGATLADAFVAQSLPAFRGAAPEDVAAVRTHRRVPGTRGGADSDPAARLAELLTECGAGTDAPEDVADVGLLPEIQRFAFLDFLTELVRCREIAAEPDPVRRAELVERRDRPEPGAAGRESSRAGRWTDLTYCLPGVELLPGYTAVMLGSEVLADPTVLVAAVSHELGHQVLMPSEVPGATGVLREPLTDLFAVLHGFGIAHANAALDETTIGTPTVETFGYLGETAVAEALAAYRFKQHRLLQDGPLLPAWHVALDPEPRARFVARLDELIGGPPSVLGW